MGSQPGAVGLLPGPLLTPGHRSAAAPQGDLPSEPAWLQHDWASSEPWPSTVLWVPCLVLTPRLLLLCTFSQCPQPRGASLACEPQSCHLFLHTWFCRPGSPRLCYHSVTPVTHVGESRRGALTSSLLSLAPVCLWVLCHEFRPQDDVSGRPLTLL